MKKINLLIAISILGFNLHAQSDSFLIQGKAPKTLDGKKLYLDFVNNGLAVSDSAVINNGEFFFKGESTDPNYARMILDDQGLGKLITQYNGDRLYFFIGNENYNIEIKDSLKNSEITGSTIQDEFVAYLDFIGGDFMNIIDQANATFRAVPTDAPDKDKQYADIKTKFDKIFDDRNDKQLEFAKLNPNSIFALEALSEVANKRGTKVVEPLFVELNKTIKNTTKGQELEARINADKNIIVGSIAPNFSQPDQNGNLIQLSDFRGKYVLLDFWASWCAPCRAENPNLKEAYNKYNAKGLEVFAISLDDKNGRNAWLKAIEDDDLPWKHAADLKGWRNDAAVLYGIKAVPQNYLIDPTGKIVATNLREERLHEVLAQHIK